MSEVDWDLTGDTLTRLRGEHAKLDEATKEDFAEFAAFVANELSEYKVDLDDESAVFHGLAFMSLLGDLARNNYENEAIDHQTAGAVTALVHSVAMVLAQRAPG